MGNMRTYALFDLIGIKKAFEDGNTPQLLESFWNVTERWTNSQSFTPVEIPSKGYTASPEAFVSTFSDSALLYTKEELSIKDFYDVVLSLKKQIETVGRVYVIVSRNDDVNISSSGPQLFGSMDNVPRYTHIAGSGKAWANLHYADKVIGKTTEWHIKYTLYCVGEHSKPATMAEKDRRECKGLHEKTFIIALE